MILNNWLPLPACVPCLKVATTAKSSGQLNVLCCADRHPPPSTRALAAAQRAGLRQDSSPLFCRIVVQASMLVLRLMLFWGYPTSELKQFRFFGFWFCFFFFNLFESLLTQSFLVLVRAEVLLCPKGPHSQGWECWHCG